MSSISFMVEISLSIEFQKFQIHIQHIKPKPFIKLIKLNFFN